MRARKFVHLPSGRVCILDREPAAFEDYLYLRPESGSVFRADPQDCQEIFPSSSGSGGR